MPLDLEPIHGRLLGLRLDFGGPDDDRPGERVFAANAPRDIAALLDEVERLRADLAATQEHRLADLAQPLYSNRVKVERLAPTEAPNGAPVSFGWKVGWVADELARARSELTGLRTYMTRSIAADLAGVPEALEILDGLADEDMATVDRWVAAMSPRCQHEAELERLRAEVTQSESRFIVRLEPGVWIAMGDPGRTLVRASAKQFPTERSARRALSKARRLREFPKAMVERVT